jgi:hypothetical protein
MFLSPAIHKSTCLVFSGCLCPTVAVSLGCPYVPELPQPHGHSLLSSANCLHWVLMASAWPWTLCHPILHSLPLLILSSPVLSAAKGKCFTKKSWFGQTFLYYFNCHFSVRFLLIPLDLKRCCEPSHALNFKRWHLFLLCMLENQL